MPETTRSLMLIAGCLLLLSSSVLKAAPDDPISPLLRIDSDDPDRHHPLWLAASEATQGGYIKWEEFAVGSQAVIQAMAEGSQYVLEKHERTLDDGECPGGTSLQSNRHDYRPNKTLQELVTNFPMIYRGQILDAAQGFLEGWPGTLYEVAVEESSQPSPSRIFVYYPFARIQAEGTVLCHQGNRYPERPEIDRQILVFVAKSYADRPLVLFPQDEEIFFERADGTLSLPAHYGEMSEGLKIEELAREALRLRGVIAQKGAESREDQ